MGRLGSSAVVSVVAHKSRTPCAGGFGGRVCPWCCLRLSAPHLRWRKYGNSSSIGNSDWGALKRQRASNTHAPPKPPGAWGPFYNSAPSDLEVFNGPQTPRQWQRVFPCAALQHGSQNAHVRLALSSIAFFSTHGSQLERLEIQRFILVVPLGDFDKLVSRYVAERLLLAGGRPVDLQRLDSVSLPQPDGLSQGGSRRSCPRC